MKKKKSSKWFSPISAAKFYGGIVVGLACFAHAINGFFTKSLDQILDFNLMSLSPIMTMVLAVVAFALAQNSYKNQRW